jgi:hypothetical protein
MAAPPLLGLIQLRYLLASIVATHPFSVGYDAIDGEDYLAPDTEFVEGMR